MTLIPPGKNGVILSASFNLLVCVLSFILLAIGTYRYPEKIINCLDTSLSSEGIFHIVMDVIYIFMLGSLLLL